jgi:hypothetical protein
MPEEPQNVDQNQPLAQPQSQPQQPVTPTAFETSVAAPNPQPINPPIIINDVSTGQPVQNTYAPQPQFGADQHAATPVDTQTEPVIANPIFSQSQPVAIAKKSKKGIIIAAVAVGVLLLVGGGSALAYNVWYSNPEKVISDAIVNAITVKNPVYTGALSIESDYIDATVDVTTKENDTTGSLDAKVSVAMNGQKYSVTGGAIIDLSGNMFFKVGGLRAIFEDYSNSGVTIDGLDEFITKVDNKWIKISSADLKTYDESIAKSNTCVNDTIKKLKNDGSMMNEITDLYKKNPFIVIEKDLGTVNGSRGFEINSKNSIVKTFMDGLKDTKVYKELHNCDDMFTIDTTDMIADATANSENTNTVVELWADSWTHQITKLKVENDDKASGQITKLSIEPKYNQDIKIEAPTDFMTLTQLQSEIEKIMQSVYDSQPTYPEGYKTDYSASSKLNKITQDQDIFTFNAIKWLN